MFRRSLLTSAALAVSLLTVAPAMASDLVFLKDFRLHDADRLIGDALGMQQASVTYFQDLASVSELEAKVRAQYERIGCHPFYVFKDGKVHEAGYNCRSFFCVGYEHGPKQCRDWRGQPYGGLAEIKRRQAQGSRNVITRSVEAYRTHAVSPEAQKRVQDLTEVLCEPFYILEYDVVVGEGFSCEEVGQYPVFSNRNTCIADWRTGSREPVCSVPLRENEMQIRRRALGVVRGYKQQGGSSSAVSVASSSASGAVHRTGSGARGGTDMAEEALRDVRQGQYGYTAIRELVRAGIMATDDRGFFRPRQRMNRAEFVTLFVGTLHTQEVQGEGGCLPDVRRQWYAPFVCAAVRRGWIGNRGRFRALAPITKAQALALLVGSMGTPPQADVVLPRNIPASHQLAPVVRAAVAWGILLEPTVNLRATLNRADAAVWIYRALRAAGRSTARGN